MLNLCHLEQSGNFPHHGSLNIWQQKIIFDPLKKCMLGHQSILCKINFWKKCHFLPEKCIFLDKMSICPPVVTSSQGPFFGGHFSTSVLKDFFSKQEHGETPSEHFCIKWTFWKFLKRKNRALLSKNVQAIFTLLNSAQKVPFMEDLKKKVSKSDWKQRHIVYVTQIRYYTWF